MDKIELLAPTGNINCLRAAVNNGADSIYIGLEKFNARINADNFKINQLDDIVKYCHLKNVKLYVALNTLIKNNEINEFFNYLNLINKAKADAIIITNQSFIPLIKKYFPNLKIHLSTQCGLFNTYSILEKVDRIILPRELLKNEIEKFSKKFETEIFVHGALCISLSGKCLFSSIIGKRSGNRGLCAQPCRKMYNDKYSLSTKDLCLIEEIPLLINLGIKCLKIEGRMKNEFYVQEVTIAYRKAIDNYYRNITKNYKDEIEKLKQIFNRNFTKGFMFENNIISNELPGNRGIIIGKVKNGKIKINKNLKIGDFVSIIKNNKLVRFKINAIKINENSVNFAKKNDEITINDNIFLENQNIYQTCIREKKLNLGEEITFRKSPNENINKINYIKEIDKNFSYQKQDKKNKFYIKVSSLKDGINADKKKPDVIYFDILNKDFSTLNEKIKNSKIYGFINGPLNDEEIKKIFSLIKNYKLHGILTKDLGLMNYINKKKLNLDIHLDYSINAFNDIDINFYKTKFNATPIISMELSFNEIKQIKNKGFLVYIHGNISLMKIKNEFKENILTDYENRKFKLIKENNYYNLINNKKLGLFNLIKKYNENNINNFYLESNENSGKLLSIYKNILEKKFNDKKIKKGYTTGWFDKGVI
ncbi:MAG: U32 family peptidase [Candidatus Woesearchaeota archaeon]